MRRRQSFREDEPLNKKKESDEQTFLKGFVKGKKTEKKNIQRYEKIRWGRLEKRDNVFRFIQI